MVKFYQSVRVDGHLEGSFTPDEFLSVEGQKKGWTATVELNGVMLSAKKSNVLVPFNNVAYIEFAKEESKPEAKSKSEKPK